MNLESVIVERYGCILSARRPIARQSRRAPVRGGAAAASTPSGLSVGTDALIMANWYPAVGRTMNGANCQVLADQSGRGDANRNLSQLTAGAQPIYNAANASYNNQDTFTIDGARWMQSAAWTTAPAQPYRYYFVGEISSAGASWMVEGRTAAARSSLYSNAGTIKMYAGTGPGDVNPMVVSAKHISCANWNGASSSYSKNAKTLTAVSPSPGTQSITGVTLCAYVDGTLRMTGVFAHLMIVDASTITAAQHGEIMDYLGARYGITVAA